MRCLRHVSSLVVLLIIPSVKAIWPFAPKRFTSNSLIGAGSLGLSESGRVVAFGDLNGDQLYVYHSIQLIIHHSHSNLSMDILMLGKDHHTLTPYFWSHGEPAIFRDGPQHAVTYEQMNLFSNHSPLFDILRK
jgi:integrin alpha FG-GAP repeat containing protein 1